MTEQSKIDSERARVVDAMCMTWRHDFGLDRQDDELGSCGMTDTERDALRRQMGQLYDHHISPLMHDRSLPVGVPDGFRHVGEVIALDDGLGTEFVCWNDARRDLPAGTQIYAAPTVKAEQVPSDRAVLVAELRKAAGEIARAGHFGWGNTMTAAADALEAPSLPAAGSAVEEVEVVAWQDADNPMYTTAERRVMLDWVNNDYPITPLMTVAQHERIVAALARPAQTEQQPVAWLPYLSDGADGVTGHYAIARKNPAGYREVWNLRRHHWAAFSDEVLTMDEALAILEKLEMPTAPIAQTAQQSAPELVSVPVELLQDLHNLASDAVEHHRAAFAGYKLKRQANMDATVDKARALLASHGRGEA